MRFLADENFPLDAVEVLRQNGHDVAWIRSDSPGAQMVMVISKSLCQAVRQRAQFRCEYCYYPELLSSN
jgi:Domain of unknown function (DUF5615)